MLHNYLFIIVLENNLIYQKKKKIYIVTLILFETNLFRYSLHVLGIHKLNNNFWMKYYGLYFISGIKR